MIGSTDVPCVRRAITTSHSFVPLSALCAGLPNAPRGLALCLHGHPSSATAFKWLMPALVQQGFYAVASAIGSRMNFGSRMNSKIGYPCFPCFSCYFNFTVWHARPMSQPNPLTASDPACSCYFLKLLGCLVARSV